MKNIVLFALILFAVLIFGCSGKKESGGETSVQEKTEDIDKFQEWDDGYKDDMKEPPEVKPNEI